MPTISTVAVLGGGLMGAGIAQVSAQAGFPTVIRELTPQLGDRARTSIEKSLAKGVERGKVTADERDRALANLTVTTDLGAVAERDLIIEAVVEDLAAKNALWAELDRAAPARTIFASNTSSLTIAAMAAATRRPDRMVGLHFFNPVPLMKLVEVVRAVTTSEATFRAVFDFARRLGKEDRKSTRLNSSHANISYA